MYSGGTSQAHNNRYEYPDDTDFDNLTKVSWAAKIYKAAAATSTSEHFVFGKMHNSNQGGFNFRSLNNNKIRAMVHDGSGGSTLLDTTLAFQDDIAYSVVATHDGDANLLTFEVSGLETLTPETSNQDPGNSVTFGLCSHDGLTGSVYYIGQVMIWPEYVLSASEKSEYHAGINVPAPAALQFWDKCIAEGPTVEQIRGATGSETGAITLFSDGVDGMFAGQGFLLPHRQMAGHNIRVLACSPEVYSLRIPQEFAALALGTEVMIADGDLPAASSLLSSLNEHFMLDDWRGMSAVILEGTIEPDGSVNLLVFNRMPSMCFFWQTAALDKGVLINAAEEGTVSLVPWAVATNDRNSQHFILDATDDSSRARLGTIGRYATKVNHLGTLYEPLVKNLVNNSAFLEDGAGPPTFLDTTETLGSGGAVNAVTATTIQMLFTEDRLHGKAVQAAEIVKGSTGDIHLAWSLAIDTSGDDARVNFWHRGVAGDYFIQRSSDSDYWSSGSTWGSSITWHAIGASASEWVRELTTLIEGMPTSGTLTLGIGMQSSSGSSGDKIYLQQVMAYQNWAVLSDIVSDGGAIITSVADDEVWDLDNEGSHDAQTFNPNRGTVRMLLRFETNAADIPNSTIMTLAVFGVTSTGYDHFFIERTGGGTLQLAAERVIGGSQDAKATIAIGAEVRGNEIEVAFRWTDTRGEELGLAARTLSVFNGGTKGTDDAATGIHSTSDQTTFIRWGNPHSGITGTVIPLTCAYLKNVELVQWAIPDEGIKARRVSVSVPSPFPVVESVTETAFAGDATAHLVSMPATVNAGDLLVLLFSCHTDETITTPSGWTELYDTDSASFVQGAAYLKDADGTEGGTTVDVVTGASQAGSAHVYRVTSWSGTLGDVESTEATSSSATPDPPSHTPSGGADDYLWIATVHAGDDDQAVSAIPSGYSNGIDTACGAGGNASGRTSSARLESNASSNDPSTFTIASSESWVSAVISIPPVA